jgi:U4/U6 small nuclear ribonucleoprotein PRP4
MVLSGHVRPILALDWAPDGFTLATGGEDNTVRVWDIRARKCTYVLPAHSNLVTGLKIWHAYGGVSRSVEEEWEPRANGEVEDVEMGSPTKTVAETPFANTGVSAEYLEPPPVPTEDESMRMAVLDGTFMVTSSYDGTAKMWSAGDWKPLKTFAGHDGKVVGVDVSDGTLLNSVMLSLRLELILSSFQTASLWRPLGTIGRSSSGRARMSSCENEMGKAGLQADMDSGLYGHLTC